jgi:hypothetical protein
MAVRPPYSCTPRRAKVFGIIVILLVVAMMVVAMIIIGGKHGPGYRVPSEGGRG